MFNPLITDLNELNEEQIQKKIEELQNKYFSAHNDVLKNQIISFLEIYQNELQERQFIKYQKEKDSADNTMFDELINIK